ncbi:MAG: hypothetical protein MUP19_01555, partial [Candidatus Aminicenantes bacterium]|nr:hypothetical protein [Candidatus Aminicenantes bacterium]
VGLLPLLFVSLLWSQDLTEAAKKEKLRRAAIQGKKVTVISNADLNGVKKKAAMGAATPSTPAEPEAGQPEAAAPQNAEEAAAPADNAEVTESVPAEAYPETLPMSADNSPETAMPSAAPNSQKSTLEANWLKAKEYADLLELKVNSLWQDFYNMDDMMPKDRIQEQLSDTFDKYQKAREDEAKAKEELDKYLGVIKK